jgi:hypothetical protein
MIEEVVVPLDGILLSIKLALLYKTALLLGCSVLVDID